VQKYDQPEPDVGILCPNQYNPLYLPCTPSGPDAQTQIHWSAVRNTGRDQQKKEIISNSKIIWSNNMCKAGPQPEGKRQNQCKDNNSQRKERIMLTAMNFKHPMNVRFALRLLSFALKSK
jgi:hypothetical protein